jgi:iron complex outermembrane receptor protein
LHNHRGPEAAQREGAMTNRIHRVSLLAASIAAVLSSAQAYAAPAEEPAASELGEIVVTARQREEKITDVPVTVQAFTTADIKAAGIERPTDFIALTAGVSQVQTAEVGDMQVSIRGINTGRDAEANFALVMDGVLQTNPNALNQELASVSQIEVLKGPQGALYGRNAVAGAIIITTRKPTDEFAADVAVGGGNYSSYKGNFWVGGPVTDNLKLSGSGYWRKTDGQWKNITLGCDDCVDYFEEKGGTIRALFNLFDGEFDFKAKYSKLDAGAINFNASIALSQVSNLLGAPPFYENTNDHVFTYVNNVRPQNEQENKNFSLKFEKQLASGNTLTAYFAFNDQTNYFLTDGTSAAFQLYFPTPATATLPAMAACQASFNAAVARVPLTPPFNYGNPASLGGSFLPPYDPTTCSGYQYQQRDQQDKSLEIRLASPGDQQLRWTAGFFFADIDRRVVVAQGSDLGLGFDTAAFVPSTGPNPTDLLYDDTYNSKVTAAFGQLAYDVAPGVELALALRYDEERRSVTNNVPTCTSVTDLTGPCRAQTAGFSFGSSPFINPSYTADPTLAVNGIPSRQNSYSQLQPKLSLNWKFSDDFAAYASYGYGFRSGGFNSTGSRATIEAAYGGLCLGTGTGFANLFPPACTTGSVRNIQNVNDDYKKEVSKAAEVGIKSFLFDRTVQFNAAVFQTKIDDMLFFNFFAGPFGLLRVVTNIDKVTINGAEADMRWKINDMFSVFAGASFVDGKIDKYLGRPYTKGNEVPYAPKYTANAGVDVNLPIGGSGLSFVGRVDASAVGETWFHPVQDNTVPNLFGFFGFGQGTFDRLKRDAFVVGNIRAGVQGDRWSATAWSRNFTDKKYLAEVIPAPEFGGAFVHDAPGRSYGLDLAYRF